jgi:hypothetical protein
MTHILAEASESAQRETLACAEAAIIERDDARALVREACDLMRWGQAIPAVRVFIERVNALDWAREG